MHPLVREGGGWWVNKIRQSLKKGGDTNQLVSSGAKKQCYIAKNEIFLLNVLSYRFTIMLSVILVAFVRLLQTHPALVHM